jgi:hypothetical protein
MGIDCGNRDACRQALEIHREVDLRQCFIEIVDIEKDSSFRCVERAEIHQMAVPAGVHRDASHRLASKILSHDGGSPAQKGEGRFHHTLVTPSQNFGDTLSVGLMENGNGVPAGWQRAIGEGFAWHAVAHRAAGCVAFRPPNVCSGSAISSCMCHNRLQNCGPIGKMKTPTIVPRDLVVPQLPQGSKFSEVMLLIIAIVGTTIAPWQLFFQQSYSGPLEPRRGRDGGALAGR